MRKIYRNGEPLSGDITLEHLGYGVFESLKAKALGGESFGILGLELHIERARKGASILSLNMPKEETIYDLLEQSISGLPQKDYRVRAVFYRNDWYLELSVLDPGPAKLKLKSFKAERFLPEIKSCSALSSVYSKAEAQKAGFDEGLLWNPNLGVTETSWGNFFLLKEGKLYTPGVGILNGVTREILMELLKGEYEILNRRFDLSFVSRKDCAFVTRSTDGVAQVIQIDELQLEESPAISRINESYLNLYHKPSKFLSVLTG